MLYTQLFIDYLSTKDVKTIKFLDETGIKESKYLMFEFANMRVVILPLTSSFDQRGRVCNNFILIDGATYTAEFLNLLLQLISPTT